MTELILSLAGSRATGYDITCVRRTPGAKDVTRKDKIPAASFGDGQPGEKLDPNRVAGVLGNQSHSVDEIKAIGESIAKTFLSGKAGEVFFKERKIVSTDHQKWLDGGKIGPEPILRTYLRIGPGELNVLPWECSRQERTNLFFDRKFPLIRLPGDEFAKAGPFDEWPVRILAVIGGGDPDVKALEEIRTLRRILRLRDHSFDIDVFDAKAPRQTGGPIEALKQRLQEFKPHIIHFAGHASFEPDPALEIVRNVAWKPEDIGTFFRSQTWRPRLIFLNACRTGLPPTTGDSFAAALGACTLSVITMNADVQGEDAADCAGKIYLAISAGEPLDRAVHATRAELGSERLASYYPVFTAMADPSVLVFAKPGCHPGSEELVDLLTQKNEIKYFIDRAAPRRELFEHIRTGRKAVAVVGDSNNGKTWFLTACSRCLAWHGYPVIYVDLRKRTSWNDLLRAILRGGEFGLKMSVEEEARRTVENIIGTTADLAQSGLLPSAAEATLNAIRPFAAGSRREVTQAPDLPLILMLDHVRLASDADRPIATDAANFLNYFFVPVREGDGRIRIVVSFEDESILKGPAADGAGWRRVDLQPFPDAEIRELTRDWVYARNPAGLAFAEPLIDRIPGPRSPRKLAIMWEELRQGQF